MAWFTFLVAVALLFGPSVSRVAAQSESLRVRTFVSSPGEVATVVEFPPGPTPKSTDFALLIDGQRVPARETRDQHLRVMFLVDVSGSMHGAPLNDIKAALREFVNTARPQDEFALTFFGDQDRLRSGFEQSRDHFKAALDKAEGRDKLTRLYQALSNTLKRSFKDDRKARPIIVVLTDGKDEGSEVELAQVIAESQAGFVPIYAVFRSKIVNIENVEKSLKDLVDLANKTSGKFVATRNQNEIASELNWMYRLETNSVTVHFTYEADRKGRPARSAMIELRRPAGPLRANLPGAVSAIHTVWSIWWLVLLLIALVALVGGGAYWIWFRRRPPEPIPVTPVVRSETPPPVVVTELPPPRRETVIIGRYSPPPTSGRPAVLLRGISGPAAGREHVVEREVFSIGADADSDLSIAEDEYVSGEHAYLRYEHGSLIIYDKASRNGTFVNDSRVPENGTVLQPGDRVKLGLSTFSVVMPGP